MHYLLFIGAFLWFAFIAPPKVALLTVGLLILVIGIVMFTARLVAGTQPSLSEASKAIALSFFFLAIAMFTLLSFSSGTGVTRFAGVAGYAVFLSFLASYVLGFKVGLGLSFGASAVVALVSTVVSTGAVLAVRALS